MIKALIFDMDGTVLNTIEDIKIAVNVALKQKGLEEKHVDDIKKAVGHGALRLIKNVCPSNFSDQEINDVFDIYQAYYQKHSSVFTTPYKGIIDLLKILKQKGYKLAVVSNKFESLVSGLNESYFENLFDITIGEVNGIPIKPAPDMLLKALKLLEVDRKEALFIGDSDVDMDTAYNAHMISVGVTWGFRDEVLLKKHHAHYIIDQPLELLDVINKENKHL